MNAKFDLPPRVHHARGMRETLISPETLSSSRQLSDSAQGKLSIEGQNLRLELAQHLLRIPLLKLSGGGKAHEALLAELQRQPSLAVRTQLELMPGPSRLDLLLKLSTAQGEIALPLNEARLNQLLLTVPGHGPAQQQAASALQRELQSMFPAMPTQGQPRLVLQGQQIQLLISQGSGRRGWIEVLTLPQLRQLFSRLLASASRVPGAQHSAGQVAGQQIPGSQAPGQPTTGQQITGQQVPGQQVPGQQIPGQQLPGQPIPGQQVPGRQATGTPNQSQPGAGPQTQRQQSTVSDPAQAAQGRQVVAGRRMAAAHNVQQADTPRLLDQAEALLKTGSRLFTLSRAAGQPAGPAGTQTEQSWQFNLPLPGSDDQQRGQLNIRREEAAPDSSDNRPAQRNWKLELSFSLPRLGAMRFQMSVDQQLQCDLSAVTEHESTLRLLRRDSEQLQQRLQRAGLECQRLQLSRQPELSREMRPPAGRSGDHALDVEV